jgi:hypothetical protein
MHKEVPTMRFAFFAVLSAAALVGLGTLVVGCVEDASTEPLKFDAKKWRAGSPQLRYRMSEDLVNSGILENKTRAEVSELLGSNKDGKGEVHFRLVSGPWYMPWDEGLRIRFDDGDRVSAVWVED